MSNGGAVITSRIRYCVFGDNCRDLNASQFYYSQLGSNVSGFKISFSVNNTRIGNTVSNITALSLQNGIIENNVTNINSNKNITGFHIGSSASNITLLAEISSCTIGQSVNNITVNYTGVMRYVEIKQRVSSLVIPATATWLNGFYNKTIFMRLDGLKRVSWMDNTDSLFVSDPAI